MIRGDQILLPYASYVESCIIKNVPRLLYCRLRTVIQAWLTNRNRREEWNQSGEPSIGEVHPRKNILAWTRRNRLQYSTYIQYVHIQYIYGLRVFFSSVLGDGIFPRQIATPSPYCTTRFACLQVWVLLPSIQIKSISPFLYHHAGSNLQGR
jgi:hypothetical protein